MPQAVQLRSYGGPEVLELVDIELPVVGDDEVLIEVRAAGVNPSDWKRRRGRRATGPLTAPLRLGADAAGVVVAVGSDVPDRSVGDEVVVFRAAGAYASHLAIAAGNTVVKPASVSWEQGAAVGIPTGTAYQALRSMGVTEDDTLLVHAGAGGVGQAAIQFARRWGVTVVATASIPNHDRLRSLGAIPVEYGEGLLQRLVAVAPQGIDVVLDAAGTDEALEVSLALVPDRSRIGTVVDVGWADAHGIRAWSAAWPGWLTDAERQLRRDGIEHALELAADGRFTWEVAATFPLAEVADAHRLSEAGHVRGKIVLTP